MTWLADQSAALWRPFAERRARVLVRYVSQRDGRKYDLRSELDARVTSRLEIQLAASHRRPPCSLARDTFSDFLPVSAVPEGRA